MTEPLLNVEGLKTYFYGRDVILRAVDGVDLEIQRGEAIALLGESGCGKTTTALSILRLIPYPGRTVAGRVMFDGQDLLRLPEEEMRRIRGRKITMVFQDPMTSLNPLLTAGLQVGEVYTAHLGIDWDQAYRKAEELMRRVGLDDPSKRVLDYPHHLSGGMRQRVMIAMALALKPPFMILDEPTSALDLTIQAQIVELIKELKREIAASVLLITHDFGLAYELCERIAVMYAGKIVEFAPKKSLLTNPLHPYTNGLINCLPKGNKRTGRLQPIQGQVPTLIDLPSGCSFHPRCPYAMDICSKQEPLTVRTGSEQRVKCFLHS